MKLKKDAIKKLLYREFIKEIIADKDKIDEKTALIFGSQETKDKLFYEWLKENDFAY